jgi:hypothetical protein
MNVGDPVLSKLFWKCFLVELGVSSGPRDRPNVRKQLDGLCPEESYKDVKGPG